MTPNTNQGYAPMTESEWESLHKPHLKLGHFDRAQMSHRLGYEQAMQQQADANRFKDELNALDKALRCKGWPLEARIKRAEELAQVQELLAAREAQIKLISELALAHIKAAERCGPEEEEYLIAFAARDAANDLRKALNIDPLPALTAACARAKVEGLNAAYDAVNNTLDQSSTNSDGQNWLQRASRGEFLAAIRKLIMSERADQIEKGE